MQLKFDEKGRFHSGEQLMGKRKDVWETGTRKHCGPDTRIMSAVTVEEKRSPPASQVWLKVGENMQSEVGWEWREMGVYVVSEGTRLSWRELTELEEGKTAEALVGVKGGVGNKKRAKKYRNP